MSVTQSRTHNGYTCVYSGLIPHSALKWWEGAQEQGPQGAAKDISGVDELGGKYLEKFSWGIRRQGGAGEKHTCNY